ncbi:MAG TPA: hypothetical protein VKZ60_03260 [Chloroflexota bacterium]|jgi:hypothetical protein|nr:hypothetical protein [Chloroflexota bacterium]
MIRQRLYKLGNSYFVPIPRQEVARLGLTEGQLLELDIKPARFAARIPPEILEAFEESWARYDDGDTSPDDSATR